MRSVNTVNREVPADKVSGNLVPSPTPKQQIETVASDGYLDWHGDVGGDVASDVASLLLNEP